MNTQQAEAPQEKSLLQLLTENKNSFNPNEKGNVKYNAKDHDDFKKGVGVSGKTACIYSVYGINIKDDYAFCESINAWGKYLYDTIPLSELAVYP